jgi:dTDP-3-amino-3,4,6-trideoxy-alpha-D-glucose transaminase
MILLNDFKRQWAEAGPDVMNAVEGVGASGWYVLGQSVDRFERALCSYWGLPAAVGVASGLDAIELSLRALGCGPGDFVLTSPISAFATPLAIVKTGATPVFADCDRYGLIDLDECEEILAKRPDIRYMVPVHLFGHSLDLEKLAALRDVFGLGIVEDSAQSIGAKWKGSPTGLNADFTAVSFYPTKNLGALGDGGAVLTHSDENAALIRRLRNYGQSSKYVHDVIGSNSRLDELQAAILGGAFLPRLSGWIEARRRIARTYLNEISSPGLRPVGAPEDSDSCWHLFPILVDPNRKPEAMSYFRSKGIEVGEHYPLALVEQRALAHLEGKLGSTCPQARQFCRAEISLPIHPYLTQDEVDLVVRACNGWR